MLADRLAKYTQSEVDTLHFVNMLDDAYHDEYYVYVEMYIIVAVNLSNFERNGCVGSIEFGILEKDYLEKVAINRDNRINEILN